MRYGMQDINWRIIIHYDDIFKKLNWHFFAVR